MKARLRHSSPAAAGLRYGSRPRLVPAANADPNTDDTEVVPPHPGFTRSKKSMIPSRRAAPDHQTRTEQSPSLQNSLRQSMAAINLYYLDVAVLDATVGIDVIAEVSAGDRLI